MRRKERRGRLSFPERYDYLEPVEINGRWVYIAEKDGSIEFIDPTQRDENGLFLKLDGITTQIETSEVIHWEEIIGSKLAQELAPIHACRTVSDNFQIVDSKEEDGTVNKYLCAKGEVIARDVTDYVEMTNSSIFIAVRHPDDRWCVYDIDGKCHLEAIAEKFTARKYGHFCFRAKNVGHYEVWKINNNSLHHIWSQNPSFRGVDYLCNNKTWIDLRTGRIMTLHSGQLVWVKDDYLTDLVAPSTDIIKMPYTLIPFARSANPEVLGLMKADTFEEIVGPAYQSIERVADVWIASHNGLKTIFSDNGDILAENLDFDSIRKYEDTCLYMAEKDGEKRLIDKSGRLIVDCKYDYIRPFTDELTNARKSNNWIILNKEGQEVR